MAVQGCAQHEQVAFVQRIERGQPLFAAGDPADHLFVVLRGALKVHAARADGSDTVLALAGPGYALGDVSMVDRGPRSAGATALVATELLAVPITAVRDLLDPASLDLLRRLAKLLFDSATGERHGRAVVGVPRAQAEIADLLGVPPAALQHALDGLAAQGWIDVGERAINLPDTGHLRRFLAS